MNADIEPVARKIANALLMRKRRRALRCSFLAEYLRSFNAAKVYVDRDHRDPWGRRREIEP
jgi:hypothetical protein